MLQPSLAATFSINGHGLLLRLQKTNPAMTAVFKRAIIPYHTHRELHSGVQGVRNQSFFNSTKLTNQLSATILPFPHEYCYNLS